MDLFAYSQIDNLSDLLSANGISIPRLRGIRKMSEEKCCDLTFDYERACAEAAYWLIHLVPAWDTTSCIGGNDHAMDYLNYYCNYSYDEKGDKTWYPTSVRWDRLHGKHRKLVKFEAKKKIRAERLQYETFNKYVGRDDVLMVHARIGGGNWEYYGGPELAKQPWFIEKVDDSYDNTYCDIYVQIPHTHS